MRIALFDYLVVPTNAVGNCDRTMLEGLADEHEFTVFAIEFDNPRPDRIRFVRIPAPKHPLFLMYLVYFFLAPIVLFLHRRREHVTFDAVQSIESIMPSATILYSHFCHRAYLRDHWQATRPSGARRIARWLNHQLFSLMEPIVYRRAQQVVVPSRGLARELSAIYAGILPKSGVQVIANPVNIARMRPEANFDRVGFRRDLGFQTGDLVLVFAALGHFERKGLPLLLEALAKSECPQIKLIVVGGSPGMIEEYTTRATQLDIADRIAFVGLQRDVRPYLWAADVFAFPSSYEVFPLVSLEAAAAGLPLLSSRLHGVEEFLVDGVNGWTIERDASLITARLRQLAAEPDKLVAVGQAAADSVRMYSTDAFVAAWRQFYLNLPSRT